MHCVLLQRRGLDLGTLSHRDGCQGQVEVDCAENEGVQSGQVREVLLDKVSERKEGNCKEKLHSFDRRTGAPHDVSLRRERAVARNSRQGDHRVLE